ALRSDFGVSVLVSAFGAASIGGVSRASASLSVSATAVGGLAGGATGAAGAAGAGCSMALTGGGGVVAGGGAIAGAGATAGGVFCAGAGASLPSLVSTALNFAGTAIQPPQARAATSRIAMISHTRWWPSLLRFGVALMSATGTS